MKTHKLKEEDSFYT